MITFQKILPEEIDYLPPQVVKYIDDAIKRTPGTTSRLDVTLDIAKKGFGNIYTIFCDGVLTGASYLLVYPTPQGKIVSPVLVGGDNMSLWLAAYYDFVYQFSHQLEAVKIRWIGRKGWVKAFPKAKVIGHIFEHEVIPK